MWEIYSRLLLEIEEMMEEPVQDYDIGTKFTYVRTKNSLGIAKTNLGQRFERKLAYKLDYTILDLISGINSWNYNEASLALAAMNAVYNIQEFKWKSEIENTHVSSSNEKEHIKKLTDLIGRKTVLMVEGMTYEENYYRNICKLSVIKEKPLQGDYPITALEYLIPDNSYVCLSGTCLVNKSIERILTISKGKQVILDGIDVPLAPQFISEGITKVIGFVADDIDKCITYIKQGYEEASLLSCGHRYEISRSEVVCD
jgi:uncharacterized protein (DUF4213/DUF364 family)